MMKIGVCKKCEKGDLFETEPHIYRDNPFGVKNNYKQTKQFCGNSLCTFVTTNTQRHYGKVTI